MTSLPWRVRAAFLLCFLTLGPRPARADEWMLIWLTGEKPQRRAFFVNVDSARPAMPDLEHAQLLMAADTQKKIDALEALWDQIHQVELVEVSEDATGYDTSQLLLEFDKATRQYRCPRGTTWHRDGKAEDYSEMEWQPLSANWQKRAFEFACDEVEWRKPYQEVRAQVLKAGGTSQSSQVDQSGLRALSYFAVGQQSVPLDLANIMWQTLWRDGSRPPYGIPASEVLASQMVKGAEASTARQRAELEKAGIDPDKPPSPDLNDSGGDGWMGASESQLVAQYGEPSSFRESAGLRYLTYREEQVEDVLGNAPPNSGLAIMKIGEIVHWHETTFIVRDGHIVDIVEEEGQF